MQQNLNIEPQYRTLMILWAALLVSQFLLLLVVFFAKPGIYNFDFTKPFLTDENSVMVIALGAVGIMTFIMSFVLKANFLKQSVATQNAGLVQTALIVGCALCEASSMMGLVLAFAFDYQYFFLWFALGILGIILHFPRRDNLIAASYKAPQ